MTTPVQEPESHEGAFAVAAAAGLLANRVANDVTVARGGRPTWRQRHLFLYALMVVPACIVAGISVIGLYAGFGDILAKVLGVPSTTVGWFQLVLPIIVFGVWRYRKAERRWNR